MNPQEPEQRAPVLLHPPVWANTPSSIPCFEQVRPHPSARSLALATLLFFLTLGTCLVAGAHFSSAYAHNQAASFDTFLHSFRLAYSHPAFLLTGVPFALTLLTILLAHELGHYFACRHHHIHSSYPFFIPAPTLTYGVLHARIVPTLSYDNNADVIFGVPLVLRLAGAILQPNAHAGDLLLHPVGRAAWVGLFATALNLLPVGQLDGGHIVRSVSPRFHRWISLLLPLVLVPLGIFLWRGWLIWACLLIGLRFFRVAPIYDPTPLDPNRRFGAFLAFVVFVLCFMPSPI